MTTYLDLYAVLRRGNMVYALPLLEAIARKARRDPAYGADFATWLAEGGTVLLRDALCRPFRQAAFLLPLRERFYDPWHEAWTALDSARLHVRAPTPGP